MAKKSNIKVLSPNAYLPFTAASLTRMAISEKTPKQAISKLQEKNLFQLKEDQDLQLISVYQQKQKMRFLKLIFCKVTFFNSGFRQVIPILSFHYRGSPVIRAFSSCFVLFVGRMIWGKGSQSFVCLVLLPSVYQCRRCSIMPSSLTAPAPPCLIPN